MYAVYAVCSIVSLTEKESGIYSANFDFRLIQYIFSLFGLLMK